MCPVDEADVCWETEEALPWDAVISCHSVSWKFENVSLAPECYRTSTWLTEL